MEGRPHGPTFWPKGRGFPHFRFLQVVTTAFSESGGTNGAAMTVFRQEIDRRAALEPLPSEQEPQVDWDDLDRERTVSVMPPRVDVSAVVLS